MTDPRVVVAPLPDYVTVALAPTARASLTEAEPCATCGQVPTQSGAPVVGAPPTAAFVYAVGRLHVRFPSLGVEKEYMQLVGADPDAAIRTADIKDALGVADRRYLAWQMCWVFSGPAADACVVVPRGDRDLEELTATLTDGDDTVHVLVGSPAISAVPSSCLATGLPAASPDQLLSFTLDEFLDALPGPVGVDAPKGKEVDVWRRTSRGLFEHLTQRSENRGLSREHRAMNYIALRYPSIYHLVYNAVRTGQALLGVEARLAPASDRWLVDIRFVLRHTDTHVLERYHCRVDTTDGFPFLASSLARTYD